MDPAGRHSGAKTVERGQTSFISLLYFALLFRSVQVHLPSCLAKWLASLLFGCGGGDSRSRRSRRRSVQSNLVDRKLTKERTAPRPDDDDKRQTKGRLGRWSKDDIKEQVDQIRRFTPRKKREQRAEGKEKESQDLDSHRPQLCHIDLIIRSRGDLHPNGGCINNELLPDGQLHKDDEPRRGTSQIKGQDAASMDHKKPQGGTDPARLIQLILGVDNLSSGGWKSSLTTQSVVKVTGALITNLFRLLILMDYKL